MHRSGPNIASMIEDASLLQMHLQDFQESIEEMQMNLQAVSDAIQTDSELPKN